MLAHEVREVLRREGLLGSSQPVLLGLSGGVDSMVLLDLLLGLGHPVVAAHAEHGLRGEAGVQDEAWLRSWCAARGVRLETTSLDVPRLRSSAPGSVEMVARSARAEWLRATAHRLGLERIATAHHRDDVVETLLMNLLRGTGIRGWRGIPRRTGPFIRPLLDIPRVRIAEHAARHSIPFREDASNADPAYLRNRVRHELVPLLRAMNPGFDRAMARSLGLLEELVAHWEAHSAKEPGSQQSAGIPFDLLEAVPFPRLVLHEALRGRAQHPDQLDRILRAVAHRRTGARFPLKEGVLIVDRRELRFVATRHGGATYPIGPDLRLPEGAPVRLLREAPLAGLRGRKVVRFDPERLDRPLLLRPWRAGDRFRPHGGRGSRLVSDVLVDAKVPRDRKDDVYVLCAGDEIAWVVGHRLAEGFAADAEREDVVYGVPVPATAGDRSP